MVKKQTNEVLEGYYDGRMCAVHIRCLTVEFKVHYRNWLCDIIFHQAKIKASDMSFLCQT